MTKKILLVKMNRCSQFLTGYELLTIAIQKNYLGKLINLI